MTITTPETEGNPTDNDIVKKVRANSRGGSWEAASRQVNGKVGELQVLIYEMLRQRGDVGFTDDELRHEMTSRFVPHSRSGVSVRRLELERAGWVRPAEFKRTSDAGVPAAVWLAVPAGEGEAHDGPQAGMSRMQRARQDAAANAIADAAQVVRGNAEYDPHNAEILLASADSIDDIADEYRTGARRA